jgi:hypothetical protein
MSPGFVVLRCGLSVGLLALSPSFLFEYVYQANKEVLKNTNVLHYLSDNYLSQNFLSPIF